LPGAGPQGKSRTSQANRNAAFMRADDRCGSLTRMASAVNQETTMQSEPHPIRRLPGGAIDIEHYSRRGARLRSDAAWATLAGMAAAVGGLRAQRARRG
jgi:hypothetical protein